MLARHLRYIAKVEGKIASRGESGADRLGIDWLCLLSHVRDHLARLDLATHTLEGNWTVEQLAAQISAAVPADPLVGFAVETVCQHGRESVALLSRELALGFARAAKLIDKMERRQLLGLA